MNHLKVWVVDRHLHTIGYCLRYFAACVYWGSGDVCSTLEGPAFTVSSSLGCAFAHSFKYCTTCTLPNVMASLSGVFPHLRTNLKYNLLYQFVINKKCVLILTSTNDNKSCFPKILTNTFNKLANMHWK